MLYQRILTAIPLAMLVCWMTFFQPTAVFFYFVLFIVFIAAYEWAKLSAVNNIAIRILFAVVIASMVWLIDQLAADYRLWPVYAAVLWWSGVSYFLRSAEPAAVSAALKTRTLFIAFIVLPAAALAMQQIHALDHGPEWLFYALSLVWVADIGAYFTGKKFGKNKLAPAISPGKTKEGLAGAVLATSLYTVLASYYFELDAESAILLVVISVIITLVSVSGDLYISLLKREAGLKDSGNILPGHGGMLDRIDSVLAAMPVFLLVFNWLIYPASI